MSKKLITAVLAGAMALSVAAVGAVSAAASVDSDGYYTADNLPDGVKANKVYFLLPNGWVNAEYNSDAGAYWWTGTGAGESADGSSQGVAWPGYRMYAAEEGNNVYYVDVPNDVAQVVFNNFIDGGELIKDADGNITGYKTSEGQFKAAQQTIDVSGFDGYVGIDDDFFCSIDEEFWEKAEEAVTGDDKSYLGDFADNFYMDESEDELGICMTFDNMIYVVDTSEPVNENVVSGKASYGGQFYFYYGKNEETGKLEYGALPNYDLAKEAGVVYEFGAGVATVDEVPSTDATDATAAATDATVPTAATGATSSVSTADTPSAATTVTSSTSAVQTGVATGTVALVVIAVAAGAVVYTRKRCK